MEAMFSDGIFLQQPGNKYTLYRYIHIPKLNHNESQTNGYGINLQLCVNNSTHVQFTSAFAACPAAGI